VASAEPAVEGRTSPKPGPRRAETTDFGVRRARLEKRAGGFFLPLLLCLGLAGTSFAQSEAPPPPSAPGKFDFFVLALSWSPGFCAASENAKAPSQCAAGAGLGFVVHGLWPQFEHGFPGDCAGDARNPSRAVLEKAAGLYPDEGLARYEWRKHGTCTGEAPADYFADVRRARDAIAIPPNFQSPRAAATMSPAAVARAFFDANPRLRPGMMAVACKRDILEEVRICLTRDLRDFRACPEVARAACRASEISVPAPR
jgi:ribonuclease T2